MSNNPRIDDLRRRVQKDPASIAFAQLAEEFRRGGQFQEAVDVCNAGLEIHPTYLSARVTLGRAFIELNKLDEAQSELEQVLKGARENLAAIRGLAEIHHRRGELGEALTQYRAALALARNDPELEFTLSELPQSPPTAPRPRCRRPTLRSRIRSSDQNRRPLPYPRAGTGRRFAPAPPIAPPAAVTFFLDTIPAPLSVASRADAPEGSTRAAPYDIGARAVARGHSSHAPASA